MLYTEQNDLDSSLCVMLCKARLWLIKEHYFCCDCFCLVAEMCTADPDQLCPVDIKTSVGTCPDARAGDSCNSGGKSMTVAHALGAYPDYPTISFRHEQTPSCLNGPFKTHASHLVSAVPLRVDKVL